MSFWDWFFLFLIFVPLFMVWITALVDIFARQDISGWWKAIDVLLIFVFPFLGTLIYLLVRPRNVPGAWGAAMAPAVQAPSAPGNVVSMADELEKLAKLRSTGAITDEEYAAAKSRLLAA